MGKIIKLKDKDGNVLLPVTTLHGVKDSASGKPLDELLEDISKNDTAYLSTESEVGTFEIEGKQHPLYERTVKFEHLPVTLGDKYSFYIPDALLGYNMFMTVRNFSASNGQPTVGFMQFYNDRYKVNAKSGDNCTVIEIICTENVEESIVVGFITLSYVKFYGDVVDIDITLPAGTAASDVSVSIPYLFANKQAMFTHTYDDQTAAVMANYMYASGHKYLPPGGFFQHVKAGFESADLSAATEPLYYTDGCGTDRRITFDVACWFGRNADGTPSSGWEDFGSLPNLAYIQQTDAKYLIDFGCRMCLHDLAFYEVKDGVWSSKDRVTLLDNYEAVNQTASAFEDMTGVLPIGMLEPSGDLGHCLSCLNCNPIKTIGRQATGNYTKAQYSMLEAMNYDSFVVEQNVWERDGVLNLNDGMWNIRAFDSSAESRLSSLASVITATRANEKVFVGNGSHNDKGNGMAIMQTVMDAHGKSGADNVWFCTMEELYEYMWIRNTARIVERNEGNTKHLRLYIPTFRGQRSKEFSLLFDGVTSSQGVTVTTSDNVYHNTYGVDNISGKLMLNIDYSPLNYQNALKYYEKWKEEKISANKAEWLVDCKYLCQLCNTELVQDILDDINS